MRTLQLSLVLSLVSVILLGPGVVGAPALKIRLEPRFGSAPLVSDSGPYVTGEGQRITVSRLDMIVSQFSVQRQNGGWLGPANWSAYVSMGEGRTAFDVPAIPGGRYTRLAFCIGLTPAVNRADPAVYAPDHPLNPNVNGMHWGWQGGYIFLALEGGWLSEGKERRGYSYHLATDRRLMRVELPVDLSVSSDLEVQLVFDLERVFGGANGIRLGDETSTTHSREDDALADQLRKSIEGAFHVTKVTPLAAVGGKPQPPAVTLIASNATSYKLKVPSYFPQPSLPEDNPLTWEGISLGALLFFDPRLSKNNAQACAACHQVNAAFSDKGRTVSRGAEGQFGTRNSMPFLNLAWRTSFFWDGRAPTLREQVLQPIQNPVEMHETLSNAVAKIRASSVNPRHRARAADTLMSTLRGEKNHSERLLNATATDYPSLFNQAFGTPEVNSDRIARALEQFLLVQVSGESKFDRFIQGQEELTAEERRGLALFNTEYDPRRRQVGADCFHCHGGPLFQSQTFANNGLDAEFKDLGRSIVTKRDTDKGKFAVPSLRNIAVTAPYMHDGRFKTLDEVIAHYCEGVRRTSTLDPNLAKHPTGGIPLSAADRQALVAFLKTLTDKRFQAY